jgi:ParB family chromosome partitioning protein
MAAWWQPTAERYLGRVPKARILEAVREGVSERDAEEIAGLKKDAMILHAERLLAGAGWLPEVLRTAAPPSPAAPGEHALAAE